VASREISSPVVVRTKPPRSVAHGPLPRRWIAVDESDAGDVRPRHPVAAEPVANPKTIRIGDDRHLQWSGGAAKTAESRPGSPRVAPNRDFYQHGDLVDRLVVGVEGLEPPATCASCRCSTT
jgi:hypothetical protein